jgi:3-deoxy-D-manno-octulosonic-acid transferase
VEVVGSTKFDVLDGPADEGRRGDARRALGVPEGVRAVVYGSVRPAEERSVVETVASIAAAFPDTWQIVAPRHLNRVRPLCRRLEGAGVKAALRSAGPAGPTFARVIVLDTTGELRTVYSIATVAFVGGTLGAYGGHNPLEPAAQGVPVVLGTHTESCPEDAAALVEGGGAVVVRSADELTEALGRCLRDEGFRARASASALRVIDGGRGATERTVRLLERRGVLAGRGGDRA